MGNYPDIGPDAVRLPPTLPPKRRAPRPRWLAPVTLAVVVALTAVGVAAALNHEVDRRLATIPPASTAPTTTTSTIPPAPPTPVTTAQVLGARVTREAAPATTSTTIAEPAPEVFEAATPSQLIAELDKLPVKEEHPQGYRRGQYGFYHDADRDNCDTREEVYVAEAANLAMNTRTCTIMSGQWFSLFDGKQTADRDELDVVHLVSLREVWESGAWEWTDAQRNAYLNDLTHPETLMAVTEESNATRKDEDPGGWLPTYQDYQCDYLKAWVYLKTVYKLSVDAGERESIAASSLYC